MSKRPSAKAQREAVARYDSKFDRINCRLEKGTKEKIRAAGYISINTFIIDAINEKLARYQAEVDPEASETVVAAHEPDCDCELCRIYRYPNAETLEAIREGNEMAEKGTGQHFKGSTADFFRMMLEEEDA